MASRVLPSAPVGLLDRPAETLSGMVPADDPEEAPGLVREVDSPVDNRRFCYYIPSDFGLVSKKYLTSGEFSVFCCRLGKQLCRIDASVLMLQHLR